MVNFLYRIVCGFFLGLSVFAPGVSGSIMAVMMGIYDRLIGIVSNPFKNFKKNFFYLVPMGIGAVMSLVLFVLAFEYLFATYEKATYLLFMGLIAGNLPIVFKNANIGGFKKHYLIGVVAAFGVALGVGFLQASQSGAAAGNIDAAPGFILLAVSGLVAGMASMIPGMSISMILIMLGVYKFLMDTASNLMHLSGSLWDGLKIVAIVGGCFIVGMVAFSQITKYVIDRHHGLAYFSIFGFMCGSLITIYIGLPANDVNFNWFVGAAMLLAGLGISLLFFLLGRKFNVPEPEAPEELEEQA